MLLAFISPMEFPGTENLVPAALQGGFLVEQAIGRLASVLMCRRVALGGGIWLFGGGRFLFNNAQHVQLAADHGDVT